MNVAVADQPTGEMTCSAAPFTAAGNSASVGPVEKAASFGCTLSSCSARTRPTESSNCVPPTIRSGLAAAILAAMGAKSVVSGG